MYPSDFPGFTPKAAVKEGETVRQGDPLLRDKDYPDICIASPAAGTVREVKRGARRKIERVVVDVEGEPQLHTTFDKATNADDLRLMLMRSGLWALMRRRPFSIVPRPSDVPRDILITCFDTSPLMPDFEKVLGDQLYYVGEAVKALKMLTPGRIFICVDEHSTIPDIPGAEMVEFNRLHPSGNPGFQLAALAPINKGEVVWTMDIFLLCKIGELVANGYYNSQVTISVVGSEVKHPMLVRTLIGASIETILHDNIKDNPYHQRIICGNVLSGGSVPYDAFMHYPYRQITVIPEGDDVHEFMGWGAPGADKMSTSRSFLGHFFKNKQFTPDARIQGGRRPMIMSEVYDKVFPMDIMPEYLIKAILAKDIDKMEALGINEVAPEDFALAEYVDPSKLELQRIVRQGLDYMRHETE